MKIIIRIDFANYASLNAKVVDRNVRTYMMVPLVA